MSVGIVDTTVILHYFRRNPAARVVHPPRPAPLAVTATTWLEVMAGAGSKAQLREAKSILDRFELLYLMVSDQQWAMEQVERFQFSHHIGMNDCQIASVAYRLGVPLYTHNLKDMQPLLGALAVKPYV